MLSEGEIGDLRRLHEQLVGLSAEDVADACSAADLVAALGELVTHAERVAPLVSAALAYSQTRDDARTAAAMALGGAAVRVLDTWLRSRRGERSARKRAS